MLMGSTLGGMALTAAGTAAVHALAYPWREIRCASRCSKCDASGACHGVQLRRRKNRAWPVADAMGIDTEGRTIDSRAKAVMEELRALVKDLEIPTNMGAFGVTEGDLDFLAQSASKVTRLLGNNPKEMSVEDIREVYSKLL